MYQEGIVIVPIPGSFYKYDMKSANPHILLLYSSHAIIILDIETTVLVLHEINTRILSSYELSVGV